MGIRNPIEELREIKAENARLKELIGLHREQKLEKDVTSADRRLWDLALQDTNTE